MTTVCPTAPADLKFQDIKADSIAKVTEDLGIDAWFLALHDNVCYIIHHIIFIHILVDNSRYDTIRK